MSIQLKVTTGATQEAGQMVQAQHNFCTKELHALHRPQAGCHSYMALEIKRRRQAVR